MDKRYRDAFNAAFTPDFYTRYMARFEAHMGVKIPFRVAETPLFLPADVRGRLSTIATEIVDQIADPSLIARLQKAVPAELDAPGQDELPSCVQVDLAICRDAEGNLTGKLVELQGFPSLYGLMPVQAEFLTGLLNEIPGLDKPFSPYLGGFDKQSYLAKLKATVLAGNDPEEVVLLDLDPPAQKTYVDFVAIERLIGVKAVCPTTLEREGNKLFRREGGRRIQVKRIFNRVVFDELLSKKISLPFAYNEALDVTWCPHPNWYWVWSKYTIPFIDHPAVPKARFLSEIDEVPADLSKYVLKPLFSFAGTGVIVDPTRADVDAVPEEQRSGFVLQEKIEYAAALHTAAGDPVKAEVRMMFLRAPGDRRPELCLNLVRMSRGKMLGVDHNKNLDWVGGTVGLWAD